MSGAHTPFYLSRCQEFNGPIIPMSPEQLSALARVERLLNDGGYNLEPAPCICGSTRSLLVGTRDRYNLPLKTHLCNDCGILRTDPRMCPESLRLFYDADYRLLYYGTAQADQAFFARQIGHGERIRSFIQSSMGELSAGVLFDVGCGAGGMLVPFKDSKWDTYGCDYGSGYLEFGRSQGLQVHHGDVSVLASYAPADVILLSHVLEHVDDPEALIRHLASHLSVNGLLYIELPGVMNIHNFYGDVLRSLHISHLFHYTQRTLQYLLARCGFEMVAGDETLRAVFRKNPNVKALPPADEAKRIRRYLAMVEIRRRAAGLHASKGLLALAGRCARLILR